MSPRHCDGCTKPSRALVAHPFLQEDGEPFLYCRPCMREAIKEQRRMCPKHDGHVRRTVLERIERLRAAAEAPAYKPIAKADPRQLDWTEREQVYTHPGSV